MVENGRNSVCNITFPCFSIYSSKLIKVASDKYFTLNVTKYQYPRRYTLSYFLSIHSVMSGGRRRVTKPQWPTSEIMRRLDLRLRDPR